VSWRQAPVARAAYSWRSDPAVPPFPDDRPVVIFDGNCVFCSAFAQFILRHDRRRRFRLTAAQTPLGTALFSHFGLDPTDYETSALLEEGRVWLKSDGILRIVAGLGFPWSLAALGLLVPQPIRDWAYQVFARHRLRWFGVRETCYVPRPDEADRFIQ
jgi:predicted DCC family thiol-disulfide oxidoreductase YuxK